MIGYQRRVNNHSPGRLVGACDEDVELVATTVCRLTDQVVQTKVIEQ